MYGPSIIIITTHPGALHFRPKPLPSLPRRLLSMKEVFRVGLVHHAGLVQVVGQGPIVHHGSQRKIYSYLLIVQCTV